MLDAFSWRRFVVHSALLGLAVFVKVRTGRVESSTPPPPELELSVSPSPPTLATAADDAPPSFDAVAALNAIGRDALSKLPPAPPQPRAGWIEVAGSCERPSKKATSQLRKRLIAWIAGQHPADRIRSALDLSVGCIEPSGLVVSFSTDLENRHERFSRKSRWWVARVTDAEVSVIADKTGTAKDDWMEWADEGMVYATALVDLDGDHSLDLVWIRTEQEGGSRWISYQVHVLRSTTGTSTEILGMNGLLDVRVSGDSLVIGAGENDVDGSLTYRCVDAQLALVRCKPADAAQLRSDRIDAASRLSSITKDDLTDREALAADLELLRVPAEERPALLDAVPAPTAEQRARRDVDAFLARMRAAEPVGDVTEATHPTAQAHFAEVRTALGDTPCETAVLTAAEQARVNEWITAAAGRTEPSLVSIGRACGPYVWAAWESYTRDTSNRREVLLLLDTDITRVLVLDAEPTGEPAFAYPLTSATAAFVRHGDEIVGHVLRPRGDHTELFAISDGRVIDKRTGAFEVYTYDRDWSDTSDTVVVDANTKAWWHATPTGLERVTLDVLHAHAKRRDAIERLASEPLTRAHAALLRQLRAPAALVREITSL